MPRWRLFVLAGLVAAPFLILVGFGMYHLWYSGLAFWLWWPLSASLAIAYFLAWRWQKKQRLLPDTATVSLHWTERDRQAWRLVEARAAQLTQLQPGQVTDLNTYVTTAQEMALELARFYHPSAQDPVGALTVPEILAVIELAAHDLGAMVDEFLPGGHLLTINDVRRVKQVADWYPTFSNISWLISSVFAPVNTALRYLAVQGGMSIPWQKLQENVLLWFFTAYVHRLGNYLIELNSGRLRVGAQRYLQLKQANEAPSAELPVDADLAASVKTVSVVLVGQAKAGKSSLINALLGEQKALTAVVPATAEITRYELQPAGISTRLCLLDTVGYGNQGPREDQLRSTEDAARAADLIVLVLHARNPARQADLTMLQSLERFFAAHPDLRKPPILAALTHIDLLSPSLEWNPPYDWQNPQRPKEHQIDQALAAVREQLGAHLNGATPVCTAPGKIFGVNEWLLPAFAGLLDQAHAVAFLRCLKAEADAGKIRKVFHQLLSVSKGLGKMLVAPDTASRG